MNRKLKALVIAGALVGWGCVSLAAGHSPRFPLPVVATPLQGITVEHAMDLAEPLPVDPTPEQRSGNPATLQDTQVGRLIERFTYVAIFGVLLLCGMGLPLPEEVPILTAGVLANTGHVRPGWALGTCLFGIMAGDSFIYYLGWRWGPRVLEHRQARRLLTAERQQKIMAYFQRYGARIIFIARFLPGIRAPLFLTAGMMRVPFWLFFTMNGSAALLGVPLCFWVGYYFTDKMEEILNLRDRAHYWGLSLVAIGLVLWLILHHWWNRGRGPRGDAG